MYSGPPWRQLSASTGCLLGPALSQGHAVNCQLSVCPFVCSHVPGITDISVNDIYGDIEVQCKAVAVWQKVFDFII